jgi:hypothetical protein
VCLVRSSPSVANEQHYETGSENLCAASQLGSAIVSDHECTKDRVAPTPHQCQCRNDRSLFAIRCDHVMDNLRRHARHQVKSDVHARTRIRPTASSPPNRSIRPCRSAQIGSTPRGVRLRIVRPISTPSRTRVPASCQRSTTPWAIPLCLPPRQHRKSGRCRCRMCLRFSQISSTGSQFCRL